MRAVDPITLEVVRGYLVSTVLQMRATLVRTAYAPILYETRDFSCGLLTPSGELAAMSEDFSGHVFAMALGLGTVLEKFSNDINPGDVIAVNDPYTGGTHMNDIAFYTPFFVEDELLLFISVRAHHSDVGGATPGSFSGQDTEIYQEGMRIVPVKIIDNGHVNQGLWDVLFANMRLQEEREGDALAMLDTARVAEMGVSELCQKYGTDTLKSCITKLLDDSEHTMRARIDQLPNGHYFYEHYMDNSGLSNKPMPIKIKMVLEGDSMSYDFTGSAPQVVGPMNCGLPVTQGGVFVALKCWLDPKSPVNGGIFRPIRFTIPQGSCLAASLPAAVGGCWEVYRQVQSAVVGLFSQIMPDQLGGETFGTSNHVYISGFDAGRNKQYILYEYPQGGIPATSDSDGATGTHHYDGGDIPCVQQSETIEQRQPLLVESLETGTDVEGAGHRRSGFGAIRRIKVLSGTGQLNVMSDRAVIPPWGAAGAPPSSLNAFAVVRNNDVLQPSEIPGKVKSFPLEANDTIVMYATAGGGVGDPLTRETHLVHQDVTNGYVTVARARDVYGVVIEDGNLDIQATATTRDRLKQQRIYYEVANSIDTWDDRGCRICQLSYGAAKRIGVSNGDMIEYVTDSTAPLRAWVQLVNGDQDGSLKLGPIGRKILGVSSGDMVRVRRLETSY